MAATMAAVDDEEENAATGGSKAAPHGGYIKQYGIGEMDQSYQRAVMEFLLANVDEVTSSAVAEVARQLEGVLDVQVVRQGS